VYIVGGATYFILDNTIPGIKYASW